MHKIAAPLKEFEQYFKKSVTTKMPDLVVHEKRLRASGLPFCGLKAAWQKITFYEEPLSDAMMPLYCDIGTAVHSILQRFLGANGKIYGAWKCRNKKCNHVVKFGCRNRCKRCSSEMEYEEFTVKAFKHLSGHIDGVFRDSSGRFWIIDYKTTSTRVLASQRTARTLPYSKNKAQIMAYVALLELIFDIEVSGWMLIYVARDNPSMIKATGGTMDAAQKKVVLDKLKLFDDQYDVVQNLKNRAQIKYLIDTKLCPSREFYVKHVRGYNPCPLEAVCFTKQLPKTVLPELDHYLETVNTKR